MKQLVPEENILYTYVMPKSGDKKRYEFIGETDKGRYMMRNVDEQCNVDFSQKWFSFLASRCLLHKETSRKKVDEENYKKIQKQLMQKEEKETQDFLGIEKEIKSIVKNADAETRSELERLTGKSYKRIYDLVFGIVVAGAEYGEVINTIIDNYFER